MDFNNLPAKDKIKIAYADPPYMGCSSYYPEHQEVDHKKLLLDLMWNYDNWALSCSSPSLGYLLNVPFVKDLVRVAAWVKPFCSFKPNVNPAYAWEPVIFRIKKQRLTRADKTVRDWVSVGITLQKGLVGAKPPAFCFWLFDLLQVQKDDEFYDLYPGTSIVTKSLELYRKQSVMQLEIPKEEIKQLAQEI